MFVLSKFGDILRAKLVDKEAVAKTCSLPATLLKRGSGTGVFLSILLNS